MPWLLMEPNKTERHCSVFCCYGCLPSKRIFFMDPLSYTVGWRTYHNIEKPKPSRLCFLFCFYRAVQSDLRAFNGPTFYKEHMCARYLYKQQAYLRIYIQHIAHCCRSNREILVKTFFWGLQKSDKNRANKRNYFIGISSGLI